MTFPTSAAPARIETIDAVRGFALLGILLMNIVGMAMPSYAYIDPLYYGLHGPADLAAWAGNYVLADGKMRALFTMLFGASIALTAERVEAAGLRDPAWAHYRRMAWLLAFGMIHAWLFWYGDILVQYAIGGAIGFFLWRLPSERLWVYFGVMFALQLALGGVHYAELAAHPGAVPGAADRARELALYRGGLAQVFAARAPMTWALQTFALPFDIPEVQAFMALGVLMLRNGFLGGDRSRADYLRVIGIGYLVAVPLTLALAALQIRHGFDPATIALADLGSLVLRPFVALAHAALVILLVRSGRLPGAARLIAVGRMAFSNYLGTTLIATTLFYGYGFGWFGRFGRAELMIVVAAIWGAMIFWSHPWLRFFRFGPLEWLWRSLSRGSSQNMRRS